jgi:GAF domain-containing protein
MNVIIKPDARLAALRDAEANALDAIRTGVSLADVLSTLILAVEALSDVEMLGSVLLVSEDGKHLLEGAAPSLPAAYNAAINGVEIGPAVGSCGTAAFYGEPVFVSDIRNDPLWTDFRDVAQEAGLRACWSLPIKDVASGRVIATFANYYREPRHPRSTDYEAISLVANAVRQAIELSRAGNIA